MFRIKKAEDRLREEKKELEKIINKRTKELKERERTLSTLMSNLPGMVYRCKNDPSWTMLFLSDGCFNLTGYHLEDWLKNKTLGFADLIFEEDKESVFLAIQSGSRSKVSQIT